MGIDFMTEELLNVSIEPANEEDIKKYYKSYGGRRLAIMDRRFD